MAADDASDTDSSSPVSLASCNALVSLASNASVYSDTTEQTTTSSDEFLDEMEQRRRRARAHLGLPSEGAAGGLIYDSSDEVHENTYVMMRLVDEYTDNTPGILM